MKVYSLGYWINFFSHNFKYLISVWSPVLVYLTCEGYLANVKFQDKQIGQWVWTHCFSANLTIFLQQGTHGRRHNVAVNKPIWIFSDQKAWMDNEPTMPDWGTVSTPEQKKKNLLIQSAKTPQTTGLPFVCEDSVKIIRSDGWYSKKQASTGYVYIPFLSKTHIPDSKKAVNCM